MKREGESSGNQTERCSGSKKKGVKRGRVTKHFSPSVTFGLWMASAHQSGAAESDAESKQERQKKHKWESRGKKENRTAWMTVKTGEKRKKHKRTGESSSRQTLFHQSLHRRGKPELCFRVPHCFHDLCSGEDNAARRLCWKDNHKSDLVFDFLFFFLLLFFLFRRPSYPLSLCSLAIICSGLFPRLLM